MCVPLLPNSCYMPCPSHPPYFIILIVFEKEYKLWSSSLCSFLQPPVTSSLIGPWWQGTHLTWANCLNVLKIRYRGLRQRHYVRLEVCTWWMWRTVVSNVMPYSLVERHSSTLHMEAAGFSICWYLSTRNALSYTRRQAVFGTNLVKFWTSDIDLGVTWMYRELTYHHDFEWQ
jgi:hypothetical protein